MSNFRTINNYNWFENWEERITTSSSTEWITKSQIRAALGLIKDNFLIRFVEKSPPTKKSLVEMFVTKNPEDISNLLAFIGRNYLTREGETGGVKIDQNLRMLVGEERENRFYLIKIGILDNKSLLEFIVENGARMMKQREELLTLLAEKIETEGRIIKNLKIDVKDSDGDTPIHRAAREDKTDTVKFLLSAGADPYITNKDGKTARDVDRTG